MQTEHGHHTWSSRVRGRCCVFCSRPCAPGSPVTLNLGCSLSSEVPVLSWFAVLLSSPLLNLGICFGTKMGFLHLFLFMFIFFKWITFLSPCWCGSVDWALACELRGHQFHPGQGTCLGFEPGPLLGVYERQPTVYTLATFYILTWSLNLLAFVFTLYSPFISLTCRLSPCPSYGHSVSGEGPRTKQHTFRDQTAPPAPRTLSALNPFIMSHRSV